MLALHLREPRCMTPGDARADARGRYGGLRQELAAGVVLRSAGRSAFGGQSGKHLLILSFSGFDPVVGPRADIPRPEQLVAVRIPLVPFQDPDGCETMRCVVLTPGGDYETPGVHHAGRRGGRVAARGARSRASGCGASACSCTRRGRNRRPPRRVHARAGATMSDFLVTRFTAVAPNGVAHARHEIRCCRGPQSTNAHSR